MGYNGQIIISSRFGLILLVVNLNTVGRADFQKEVEGLSACSILSYNFFC